MDRREFLKQVSLWTAGMIAAPPVLKLMPEAFAKSGTSRLAVGTGTNYTTLVKSVISPLGGMGAFVKKGNTVVIKPNIGWDRTPAQGANTNPEVVKAVVKMALDAGASKVMVFDSSCNDERRCYASSGIKAAVESINDKRVICSYMDKRKFVPIKIKKGKVVKDWTFYKDVLEADCYINLPVAKHHGLSNLTLGMKNVMGVIGGNRAEIHFDIGQSLADLNTIIKPRLTIIDATRMLLRNGPTGGNTNDVKIMNTILASSDIVAADAYATTLFNLKPEQIASTVAAYKMGMGEMNLSKVKIIRV